MKILSAIFSTQYCNWVVWNLSLDHFSSRIIINDYYKITAVGQWGEFMGFAQTVSRSSASDVNYTSKPAKLAKLL